MRVAVIGAGILGASIAWHLARARVEVVLVDRADPGRATDAGAGIVCPWGAPDPHPARYALAAGAARYYPELVAALAEEGETELGYRRVGALFVSDDPDKLARVEQRVRSRLPDAPEAGPVDRLTPSEARSLFPPLGEGIAAVRVGGGARVDGRLAAQALQRAAIARGAEVRKGTASLLLGGGRVRGVSVDGEILECDAVVAAVGAWAAELLAPAGVRIPVAPQRGQIIHLRLPGADTAAWPILEPMNGYYLLAFDDSRVVVGATRETGSGFDYRLTAGGVAEVLNAGLAVAPGLADWALHETRIGFRPLAADDRPILGPVAGLDNLVIAGGLGASGLTLGPYAGALVAQLLARGETELPLAPFHPARSGAQPFSRSTVS
jgi:D-amino-acid dehydrogenase